MATKTISITEDAYGILKSWKQENDSFSDVIKRKGKKTRLSELAGILTKEEADDLERNIKSGRALSRKRELRIRGLLN